MSEKLSWLHRNILDALRGKRRLGVDEQDLIKAAYRGRKPPFYPLLAMQAAIRSLNRRMKGRQIVLKTNKIGKPSRRYHLIRSTGGDHNATVDHRPARRHHVRGAADGVPAGREAE